MDGEADSCTDLVEKKTGLKNIPGKKKKKRKQGEKDWQLAGLQGMELLS